MSTQEDSFTGKSKNESDVETSFRFSETRSPERLPRISRDAVRRQMEQQHLGDSPRNTQFQSSLNINPETETFHSDRDPSPSSPFRRSYYSPAASPGLQARPQQFSSSPFLTDRTNVNLEDLEDAHSALDRLMLGVEKGFEPSINSNVSDMDEDDHSDREPQETAPAAPDGFDREESVADAASFADGDLVADIPLLRESTAMSGASTTTTSGPYTPQMPEAVFSNALSLSKEPELSFNDSKPLPPPPESYSPLPAMQLTLEEEGATKDVASSLSVPSVSVRRGSTIKKREEAILAKRREQRALEGRPSRRRSQSTGDLKAKVCLSAPLLNAHLMTPTVAARGYRSA